MTPPSSRVSSRLPLGGVAGAIACRFLGAGQEDERTEGQEPEAIPYEAGPEGNLSVVGSSDQPPFGRSDSSIRRMRTSQPIRGACALGRVPCRRLDTNSDS